jgi:hypothetical protein
VVATEYEQNGAFGPRLGEDDHRRLGQQHDDQGKACHHLE